MNGGAEEEEPRELMGGGSADAEAVGTWMAGLLNGLLEGLVTKAPTAGEQPQPHPASCELMQRVREELLAPVAAKLYSDAYPFVVGTFAAVTVNLFLCAIMLYLTVRRRGRC